MRSATITLIRAVSWTILVLWACHGWLLSAMSIVYTSEELAAVCRTMWLWLVPIAVGSLVLFSGGRQGMHYGHVLIAMVTLVFTFGVVSFFNEMHSICSWDISAPLYRHRTASVEVRRPTYDCGASDSDPLVYMVKTEGPGTYWMRYNRIALSDLDKKDWVRLSE